MEIGGAEGSGGRWKRCRLDVIAFSRLFSLQMDSFLFLGSRCVGSLSLSFCFPFPCSGLCLLETQALAPVETHSPVEQPYRSN
jgi:hypothetical protein